LLTEEHSKTELEGTSTRFKRHSSITTAINNYYRREKIVRARYIDILSSSISLIQQQCKMDWIKHGDNNTSFLFVKAK